MATQSSSPPLSGLLVDEVLDIVTVQPNEISMLPGGANTADNRLFSGLVTNGAQITAILNLEQLLTLEPSKLSSITAAA
jgi:chemotaxis signal transduction protein